MVRKYWQKIIFALSFGLLYFWPKLAFGQITPTCPSGTSPQNGTCVITGGSGLAGSNTFGGLVGGVLGILMGIVGLIAVMFIVIGGYKYVTANGDEEQIKSAKSTIVNALIGVALTLLAYALVRIISNAVTTTGNV